MSQGTVVEKVNKIALSKTGDEKGGEQMKTGHGGPLKTNAFGGEKTRAFQVSRKKSCVGGPYLMIEQRHARLME